MDAIEHQEEKRRDMNMTIEDLQDLQMEEPSNNIRICDVNNRVFTKNDLPKSKPNIRRTQSCLHDVSRTSSIPQKTNLKHLKDFNNRSEIRKVPAYFKGKFITVQNGFYILILIYMFFI